MLGIFAFKSSTHFIIIGIFFQPNPNWNWEAKLLLGSRFGSLRWSVLFGSQSHCIFGDIAGVGIGHFFSGYPVTSRNLLCQLHDFFIQEGNTQFQRVCHAHFIGFQQNIAGHPHVEIQILHLGDIVLILYLIVVRLCNCGWIWCSCFDFQNGLAVFWGKHIGVSDEALFQGFSLSYKEVDTAVCGDFLCQMTNATAQSHGQFVIHGGVRFAVYVIAAEDFIGTFSGKNYFQGL